jgi:hypothetical protein
MDRSTTQKSAVCRNKLIPCMNTLITPFFIYNLQLPNCSREIFARQHNQANREPQNLLRIMQTAGSIHLFSKASSPTCRAQSGRRKKTVPSIYCRPTFIFPVLHVRNNLKNFRNFGNQDRKQLFCQLFCVYAKSDVLLWEMNINCKCLETKFRDNYEGMKGMKY